MLLNILIVLVVVILFLFAFILLRTLTFPRQSQAVEPVANQPVDLQRVAVHLSEAVQCQTVSMQESTKNNPDAFLKLQRILEQNYPLLHTTLRRVLINEYSLVYIWPGSKAELDPVLFASHQDVVPADPHTLGEWTYPPFSGQVADGFVWGRGTMDMKNQLIALMESIEMLLQSGYQPERTVYLAFGHDEEISGLNGAGKIVSWLQDQGVHLAAMLDEGSMIVEGVLPGVKGPVALIGTGEKGYLTLQLSVDGIPGHSSVPPAHTAIGVLSGAISRLEAQPLPATLQGAQTLFRHLGTAAPFSMQLAFANLWLFGPLVRSRLLSNLKTAASARTTTAVTVISGGIKDNILPSRAEALVNFRLMPGDTIASICETVRRIIADANVKIEALEGFASDPPPISPLDGAVYTGLECTIRQVFGDMPVAPFLVLGATDARHYSPVCSHIYRFMPLRMQGEDLDRIHGIDERISLEALTGMVQFFSRMIQTWSGESLLG